MKDYYEILEVAKNASPEVIEKAYKALIKKYHPDLQPEEKKEEAENKIKLINEAYSVLSDSEKKSNYDSELRKIDAQNKEQNIASNISKNHYQENIKNNRQNLYKQQEIDRINAINTAYNDAYVDALRNMGYKVKYKKTFKQWIKYILAIIFTIIFLIFFGFILWHIPFIKNFLIDLYNGNEFVKIFVDAIHSIFTNILNLFS